MKVGGNLEWGAGSSRLRVSLATHASWCSHLPSVPCVPAPLSQVSLTLLKHLVSKHSLGRLETLTGSAAGQAQDKGVNSEDAGGECLGDGS